MPRVAKLSQASCYSSNGETGDAEPLCTNLNSSTTNHDTGRHLALTSNGKFLYADDGYAITVFSVNDANGDLTPTSCASEPDVGGCGDHTFPADTNSNAAEMVISPDNKFLYFSSPAGPEVQWMSINPSTGELTNSGTAQAESCIQDVAQNAGNDNCVSSMRGISSMVGALAMSPDSNGQYVFALSGGEYAVGGIAVLSRNPVTGVLTQVTGTAGCATSDGSDDENAGHEPGGPFPCEDDPGMEQAESLVVSPDSQNIYVMTGYEGNESMIELYFNSATGALTEDSDVFDDCYTSNIREDAEPFCTGYNGMYGIAGGLNGEATVAVSPDGQSVYVTSDGDSGLAIFQRQTPASYTVSASASPSIGGSVTAASTSTGAQCSSASCTVYVGGAVTLQATASTGYRFKDWSGGSCAAATDPCVLSNVSQSETDTANFVKRVTVTGVVSGGTGGTISASDSSTNSPDCSDATCTVDAGDTVKLAVTPAAGYELTGWSGGTCTGKTNPCLITDVAANETDTATFAPVPRYTVKGAVSGSASNTVTVGDAAADASCSPGSCTVNAGDTVKLTANAATGYLYKGWSGGTCSGLNNPCTITNVQASETDTATFKPGYTIAATVSVADAQAGNTVKATDPTAGASCLKGTCEANPGDTVTLTADPHLGYQFSAWSVGSCTGGTNPCVLNNVSKNETDRASFAPTGAVISGTVTKFASYGPGQAVPLLSSYSNLSVEVINTKTSQVVSGPVTPDASGSYSLVVVDSDCSGADTSHKCKLEALAGHSVGASQSLTLPAAATAETIDLSYGEETGVGIAGKVVSPPDDATVSTRLTVQASITSGHGSVEATIYTGTNLCPQSKCGVGSYLIVLNLSSYHGDFVSVNQVDLEELHGSSDWVLVNSAAATNSSSNIKSVKPVQAVDPVPSADENEIFTGQVWKVKAYAPTLHPPLPVAANGVGVAVTPETSFGKQVPAVTADSKGFYEVGGMTRDSKYLIQGEQGGSDGFPQVIKVPTIEPQVSVFNFWFDANGDVPLRGEIVPPTDKANVKTELIVTAGTNTIYDTRTSGLCGSSDACSSGYYMIPVPAQGAYSAGKNKFTVELLEENSSSKWVKVSSVNVPSGAPFVGDESVKQLQAVDPPPTS